jgi:ribonucleoside-triphosphate reductase
MELAFKLDDAFVDEYSLRSVPWGFPSGDKGMSIGELTFLRTYSRKQEDGSKERWHETVRRVVEGVYSIQKDYVENVIGTPWDEDKAQASAQEMYERMFTFKFWPPGRGLENMGTEGVNGWGYSDRLYNCAFESTRGGGSAPYGNLFSKSMRGVGVGYDTLGAGADRIQSPVGTYEYVIPDSTEGWVHSTTALLDAFFTGGPLPIFEYGGIREKGSPIRSGGIAPGADPLRLLHTRLTEYYGRLSGSLTTSRTIVDTANLIGKAVVAGGKRRTALISLGDHRDDDFRNLKNFDLPENAERMDPKTGWGWASNNSLVLTREDSMDFEEYAAMQINGEPGLFVRDLQQNYGRMIDGQQTGIDGDAEGTNPCGEITLESGETCNVVSINLNNHSTREDYLRTCKFAFLYAKTVTLMRTSWKHTNAVQMRNRRIGVSLTGVSQFLQWHADTTLALWMDEGYEELKGWDKVYSRWFGVRESIKLTTIKPEGTASLLAGATPGVHYPVHSTYIRRIQFADTDPLLQVLADAGYTIEDANGHDTTKVVEFPVKTEPIPSERNLSIEQKLRVALLAQRYWSDNAVSFTLKFWPHEKEELARVLQKYWGQYKSITCDPIYGDESNAKEMQLPYQGISDLQYAAECDKLDAVDLERIYEGAGLAAVGDKFCDGDICVI